MVKMQGHAEGQFSGDLPWENVLPIWKRILEPLSDCSGKGIIIRRKEEEIPSYEEIAKMYWVEKKAPWSSGEQRTEAAFK
jgi:hypothetical protein